MKEYPKVEYNHIPLFKDTSPQQWDDWKWQMGNAIRDIDTLSKIIELEPMEKELNSQFLSQKDVAINHHIELNYLVFTCVWGGYVVAT